MLFALSLSFVVAVVVMVMMMLYTCMYQLSPEFDDMWIGHSAWFVYENTNRIFKRYLFRFENISSNVNHMAFSSYPGYLESLDDFYIMNNGLAMLQTTNSIPNVTVYDKVTPYALYAWQRVRIANQLSYGSPQQWYDYLKQYNSGTYNNQYMVLKYSDIKAGVPLQDTSDVLWVIEQMPGKVSGSDMTQVLRR